MSKWNQMMGVAPPCGSECPRRCVGCRRTCGAWQDYERQKEEVYKKRRASADIGGFFAATYQRRMGRKAR